MPTVEQDPDVPEPAEANENYPDGEAENVKEDELMLELTLEELKEAFRWILLFDL